MADLQLAPGGDLLIKEGRLGLTQGAEAVRQRLELSLSLFQGEWFLDLEQGVPWFEFLLGSKAPNLEIAKAILRQFATAVDGVATATVKIDLDSTERVAKIVIDAVTDDNVQIQATLTSIKGVA